MRGYTVEQQLDDAAPGTREVLAADAAGACVVLRVPEDPVIAARMRDEAELAGRHPHQQIVQSVGVLEHEQWPVQVLEHVDGLRLDTLTLIAGALPPEAACRLGWQIGIALTELHGKSPVLAHGALSSERIVVDAKGNARLRDFGRLAPEQPERLMSPERRVGREPPSVADDIFALGLLVAEAALGHPLELAGGHLRAPVLEGLLPDRLVDALKAMLGPVEARFSNAAAAVRALVELEYAIGDGQRALRLAVERARLGLAFGAIADETEDGDERLDDTLQPGVTMPELARAAAPFVEEEPTLPNAPPPFVAAAASPKQSPAGAIAGLGGAALVVAAMVMTAVTAQHAAASALGAFDARSWPSLPVPATAAAPSSVHLPSLPSLPSVHMPSLPSVHMPSLPSLAALEDAARARVAGALPALGGAPGAPPATSVVAGPAAPSTASTTSAVAGPGAPVSPGAPSSTNGSSATPRAPATAFAAGAAAASAPGAGAAPRFVVSQEGRRAHHRVRHEPVAHDAHAAHAEAAVEQRPLVEHRAQATPVEAAPPGPAVKLVAGVSAAERAAAEAKLRGCRPKGGTVGVIHPNGAATVTSEPRNACVNRVLARVLHGFAGSDEPFEIDVTSAR